MSARFRPDRLAKVSRALRESEHPEVFTMSFYTHPCGSPACALGHYVARHDLQRTFEPGPVPLVARTIRRIKGCYGPEVTSHFGIAEHEAKELFASDGCDRACSANTAADYIDKFIARKRGKL